MAVLRSQHRTSLLASLALGLSLVSCSGLQDTFTPKRPVAREPNAALDQPPPLHTGGLGVLAVDASTGRQGPDSSASHGDATADAIATGAAVIVIGSTATTTAIACSQPYSTATCLRGPGPADNEEPDPDQAPADGPILPLVSPP